MKVTIVNMPFPPVGVHPLQSDMLDQATMQAADTLGGPATVADSDVVMAMFPDGSHRVVKNFEAHEITVLRR